MNSFSEAIYSFLEKVKTEGLFSGVLNKHMKSAHDPKKVPKVPREKKKKVKREVSEQTGVAMAQLPPMQSIQVEIENDGDNVRVSLPSVVPGLALTVPEITTVQLPANNPGQNYQVTLQPTLVISSSFFTEYSAPDTKPDQHTDLPLLQPQPLAKMKSKRRSLNLDRDPSHDNKCVPSGVMCVLCNERGRPVRA